MIQFSLKTGTVTLLYTIMTFNGVGGYISGGLAEGGGDYDDNQ